MGGIELESVREVLAAMKIELLMAPSFAPA
jgi:hypothetical protein